MKQVCLRKFFIPSWFLCSVNFPLYLGLPFVLSGFQLILLLSLTNEKLLPQYHFKILVKVVDVPQTDTMGLKGMLALWILVNHRIWQEACCHQKGKVWCIDPWNLVLWNFVDPKVVWVLWHGWFWSCLCTLGILLGH